MPRTPTTNGNAELAVEMFDDIMAANAWSLDKAWLAIAKLLMTCEVWRDTAWRNLENMPPGTPVLMESNNYKLTRTGDPNSYMRNAIDVRDYIAKELSVVPDALCNEIGLYFRHPQVSHLQPNNLRGHAFRSLIAQTISLYGDPALEIREEHDAHELFPGSPLATRSQEP